MPRAHTKLKEEIVGKVQSGKYMLGELIEPKSFWKYTTTSDGKIEKVQFTVAGRKIPMREIQKRMYQYHKETGVLRENLTEVNRFLITWADHASVLNLGYLLFTVKTLYTPSIFYTDEEMQARTGIAADVQKIVETPNIYILGRAADTSSEKLTYIESRLEDIQQLNVPLEIDRVTINDTMRFFHGR